MRESQDHNTGQQESCQHIFADYAYPDLSYYGEPLGTGHVPAQRCTLCGFVVRPLTTLEKRAISRLHTRSAMDTQMLVAAEGRAQRG